MSFLEYFETEVKKEIKNEELYNVVHKLLTSDIYALNNESYLEEINKEIGANKQGDLSKRMFVKDDSKKQFLKGGHKYNIAQAMDIKYGGISPNGHDNKKGGLGEHSIKTFELLKGYFDKNSASYSRMPVAWLNCPRCAFVGRAYTTNNMKRLYEDHKDTLLLGGLLHDIGKVFLDNQIFRNPKLKNETVKLHEYYGYDALNLFRNELQKAYRHNSMAYDPLSYSEYFYHALLDCAGCHHNIYKNTLTADLSVSESTNIYINSKSTLPMYLVSFADKVVAGDKHKESKVLDELFRYYLLVFVDGDLVSHTIAQELTLRYGKHWKDMIKKPLIRWGIKTIRGNILMADFYR